MYNIPIFIVKSTVKVVAGMKLENADKYIWNHRDIFANTGGDYLRSYTERNYSAKMHIHSFYEVNIVLEGEGEHFFNNNCFATKRGDVYVIPPYIPHGYRNTDNLSVYHIFIHNLFFDDYAKELETFSSYYMLFTIEPLLNEVYEAPLFLKLNDIEFCHIKQLLNYLTDLSYENNYQTYMLRSSLGLYLILQLCSFHQSKINPSTPVFSSLQYEFLENIKYIFYHYNEKITVNEMAQKAHMCKNAFLSHFKEIFNTTPGAFLLEYRLLKAKNMLMYSDSSVSNIAELTGFYDTAHFIHGFKKKEGVSPTEYRISHAY